MTRLLLDLADEAVDVLETCNLSPQEKRAYLAAWICEVVVDVGYEQIKSEEKKHRDRYTRLLNKARRNQ